MNTILAGRFTPRALQFLLAFFYIFSPAARAHSQEPRDEVIIRGAEHTVAVENICAWPGLVLMPDGIIAAAVFNKPSHGLEEGDVDCYVSADGGRTWEYAGTPAPHEQGKIRMNHAIGVGADSSLIVLCSGWGGEGYRKHILPVMVSRSRDRGRTWERNGSVQLNQDMPNLIPFGTIARLDRATLAVSLYDAATSGVFNRAYLFFSYDDGLTWKNPVIVGIKDVLFIPEAGNFNETAVLCTGRNRLIAVSRTFIPAADLRFLVSENRGRTWTISENSPDGAITRQYEHPGHLLKLRDGGILLTYGIRWGDHGIGARISRDGGSTWSAPLRVISYGGNDNGYPSSVQLDDGTVVTAFYSDTNRYHRGYYMGTVRWKIPSGLQSR